MSGANVKDLRSKLFSQGAKSTQSSAVLLIKGQISVKNITRVTSLLSEDTRFFISHLQHFQVRSRHCSLTTGHFFFGTEVDALMDRKDSWSMDEERYNKRITLAKVEISSMQS